MTEQPRTFVLVNAWTGQTRNCGGLQKVQLPAPAKDLCVSCHRQQKMAGSDICARCDHAADQWREADEWLETTDEL